MSERDWTTNRPCPDPERYDAEAKMLEDAYKCHGPRHNRVPFPDGNGCQACAALTISEFQNKIEAGVLPDPWEPWPGEPICPDCGKPAGTDNHLQFHDPPHAR